MSKLTEYKNKYIAENYDRINLTVPKGMKAQIEQRAKAEGKSTNGFIGDLLKQVLNGVAVEPKAAVLPKKEENTKKDMDIFLF